MNKPFFLAYISSGLGVDGLSGGGGGGSSKVSLVSSPSPLYGIGGSLLVGYEDLVFCADTQVSDGLLALGLTEISLFFLGAGMSSCSSYCLPVLAF